MKVLFLTFALSSLLTTVNAISCYKCFETKQTLNSGEISRESCQESNKIVCGPEFDACTTLVSNYRYEYHNDVLEVSVAGRNCAQSTSPEMVDEGEMCSGLKSQLVGAVPLSNFNCKLKTCRTDLCNRQGSGEDEETGREENEEIEPAAKKKKKNRRKKQKNKHQNNKL